MVARRCPAKKLPQKFHKIHRKIPLLESLSNTIKVLRTIRLATLLKRNPHTRVSEPAVRRCSTKQMLLKNFKNLLENTCVGVPFLIKFRSSRSLCSQIFFKIDALENFANFTGRLLCRSLFLIKSLALRIVSGFQPATLLKRNSNEVVFLWILRDF